jgi:hypothetical protein
MALNLVTYSDIKTDFEPHPLTGDISIVTDIDSIKQSVVNIVFTDFYERYFSPTFGAGVPQNLFENMVPQTRYEIEKRINEAVENFEPRARIVRTRVTPSPDDNNIVVTIVFRPVNSTEDVSVQRILRRIR